MLHYVAIGIALFLTLFFVGGISIEIIRDRKIRKQEEWDYQCYSNPNMTFYQP